MPEKFVVALDIDGVITQKIDIARTAVIKAVESDADKIFEIIFNLPGKYEPADTMEAFERIGRGKLDSIVNKTRKIATAKGKKSVAELREIFVQVAGEKAAAEFDRTSTRIANEIISGKGKWEPGATVEVMGQKYLVGTLVKNLREIVKGAPITRGVKGFIKEMKKTPRVSNVYLVTAAYSPSARCIARRIGVDPKNVYGTRVRSENGIIQRIGKVRGGRYKVKALKRIMRKEGIPPGKVVFIGDSITDRNALRFVRRKGGLDIGFNPTREAMAEARILTATGTFSDITPVVKEFLRKKEVRELTFQGGVARWRKARRGNNHDRVRLIAPILMRLPYTKAGKKFRGAHAKGEAVPAPYCAPAIEAVRVHDPMYYITRRTIGEALKPRPAAESVPGTPAWAAGMIASARNRLRGRKLARLR